MWLWYSIALPGKVLPPPVYVNSTYPGKALHPACLKGKKQWELLQTVDHGFRISSQTNARASTILQQLSESALQLPTLRFCRGQSHFSQNSTEMTKWNRGTLSWFPLSLHLRVQLSSCMGCGTYPYEYTIEIIAWCDTSISVAPIWTHRPRKHAYPHSWLVKHEVHSSCSVKCQIRLY